MELSSQVLDFPDIVFVRGYFIELFYFVEISRSFW